MIGEKRPRHYAAETVALPTKEQRQAALDKAPKEWKALIRKHVEITFYLTSHRR